MKDQEKSICFSEEFEKLEELATYFYEELLCEAHHEESGADWSELLRYLYTAASGHQELAQPKNDDELTQVTVLAFFQEKVNAARLALDTAKSPVDSIYEALYNVGLARCSVRLCRKNLKAGTAEESKTNGYALAEREFPSIAKTEMLLREATGQLQEAITTAADPERSRASRRVFLITHFARTIHPALWQRAIFEEIVWLHRQAVERMTAGYDRQAVQRRLEILAMVDPRASTNWPSDFVAVSAGYAAAS